MSRWVSLSSILPLFISIPLIMPAQTAATATISGTVTDNSGAVVPGANVAMLDTATSSARTQRTNSEGQFTFVGLPPGDYKITVTMASFRQSVLSLKTE